MKIMFTPRLKAVVFLCLFSIFSLNVFGQVGIGTTSPNPNALLDVDATTSPGGILLPRLALSSTSSFAPMTSHVAGMIVYNTSSSGDLTPGYYYNDGIKWVRLAADRKEWSRLGNAGTIPGTGVGQSYLGTSDSKNLVLATGGTTAFTINTAQRLIADSDGTAASPTYSFNGNSNLGMYRSGANRLSFSTNNAERLRIDNQGDVKIGTGDASEKLEVDGNLRLNGAFMPNNIVGGTDKILLSQGAGTPPVWGPGFLNTAEITDIGKYYSGVFNMPSGSAIAYTITDPNMTVDSVVSCNFVALPNPNGNLVYGYNFTLIADPQNGQVVFYIANASNRNLTNLQIQYIAYYN